MPKISALTTSTTAPVLTDVFPTDEAMTTTPVTKKKAWSVYLAAAAAVTTGTNAALAITPDSLAGSDFGKRAGSVQLFAAATALATGDGKAYLGPAPASLAGFDLIKVTATVFAKSTNATSLNFTVERGRQADATTAHAWVDMLSTACTIDQNEYSSLYDAHQMVVDATKDDVLEGDLFRFNCDFAGTAATGCWMTLEFQKP